MLEKVKPCPHCGSKNVEVHQSNWSPFDWYTICNDCYCGRGYRYSNSEDAALAWNNGISTIPLPECPHCGGWLNVRDNTLLECQLSSKHVGTFNPETHELKFAPKWRRKAVRHHA